jgi:hypothetical protein
LDARRAYRFDFPPLKHQSSLMLLLDEVIVERFSVLSDAHVDVWWFIALNCNSWQTTDVSIARWK